MASRERLRGSWRPTGDSSGSGESNNHSPTGDPRLSAGKPSHGTTSSICCAWQHHSPPLTSGRPGTSQRNTHGSPHRAQSKAPRAPRRGRRAQSRRGHGGENQGRPPLYVHRPRAPAGVLFDLRRDRAGRSENAVAAAAAPQERARQLPRAARRHPDPGLPGEQGRSQARGFPGVRYLEAGGAARDRVLRPVGRARVPGRPLCFLHGRPLRAHHHRRAGLRPEAPQGPPVLHDRGPGESIPAEGGGTLVDAGPEEGRQGRPAAASRRAVLRFRVPAAPHPLLPRAPGPRLHRLHRRWHRDPRHLGQGATETHQPPRLPSAIPRLHSHRAAAVRPRTCSSSPTRRPGTMDSTGPSATGWWTCGWNRTR